MTVTVEDINEFGINKCVAWYLVHSYLYYQCDTSMLDDVVYDYLCKRLFNEINEATHMHKDFLDVDALKAGSAYHIHQFDYPTVIKSVAYNMRYGYWDVYGNELKKKEYK